MKRKAPAFALLLLLVPSPVRSLPTEPLRLSFVGDLMAHDVNYEMADYDRIYDGIRDLFLADDLTFANLELVVDPSRPRILRVELQRMSRAALDLRRRAGGGRTCSRGAAPTMFRRARGGGGSPRCVRW